MKFLVKSGNSDSLKLNECEVPSPQNNEMLIEVYASGINRADLLQIAGHYPPPPGASDIVGLEVAGIVVNAPNNSRFKPGDEVMALLAGGGYAQYVCVDVGSVMPMPAGYSFSEAAAIPEAFITAYQALFEIGNLDQRSQDGNQVRVLIHAGASGVGSAAIQLAHLSGCEVFTTASSERKLEPLIALGAQHTINYNQQCFAQQISEITKGEGVDIIIDFIGGSYLKRNIDSISVDGIIVTLAMLGGRFGEKLDFGKLLLKRATLCGSTLRSRTNAYKQQLVSRFEQQFLDAFSQQQLQPIIDSVYRYEEVNEALAHIGQNKNIGKLVLHQFDDC